ncbi:uncharacterized protein V6R79_011548 [Siganus canaliculatus]
MASSPLTCSSSRRACAPGPKLPTLVIVAIPSSETLAETQTIASDSSHFRAFIQHDAEFEKRTNVIQLAVHDLTICWKISVSSQDLMFRKISPIGRQGDRRNTEPFVSRTKSTKQPQRALLCIVITGITFISFTTGKAVTSC